ncbi:gyrA, partial [Symbiodinium sp. CCMP2592]
MLGEPPLVPAPSPVLGASPADDGSPDFPDGIEDIEADPGTPADEVLFDIPLLSELDSDVEPVGEDTPPPVPNATPELDHTPGPEDAELREALALLGLDIASVYAARPDTWKTLLVSGYRRSARAAHPDTNPGDAQAPARFRELVRRREVAEAILKEWHRIRELFPKLMPSCFCNRCLAVHKARSKCEDCFGPPGSKKRGHKCGLSGIGRVMRFNPQIVPDIIKHKGHGWDDDDSHRMALKAHKTKTFVEEKQQELDKLVKKRKKEEADLAFQQDLAIEIQ